MQNFQDRCEFVNERSKYSVSSALEHLGTIGRPSAGGDVLLDPVPGGLHLVVLGQELRAGVLALLVLAAGLLSRTCSGCLGFILRGCV